MTDLKYYSSEALCFEVYKEDNWREIAAEEAPHKLKRLAIHRNELIGRLALRMPNLQNKGTEEEVYAWWWKHMGYKEIKDITMSGHVCILVNGVQTNDIMFEGE